MHEADARALTLGDLGGANRLDSLSNLLCSPGQIGMIFIIPGFDDIFRINGRAEVRLDADLLARFVEFGPPPISALAIALEEALLHCPLALMRGRL